MSITLKNLREALGGYEPTPRKEKEFANKHSVKITDPIKAPQSNTVGTISGSGEYSKSEKNGDRSIPKQGSSEVDAKFPTSITPTELPGGRERKGDLKIIKSPLKNESIQFAVISDEVHFFDEDLKAAEFADSQISEGKKVYLCKVLSAK